MRHILVNNVDKLGFFQLSDEQANHFKKVLRMDWDESIYILNGRGQKYLGCLRKKNDRAHVEATQLIENQTLGHQVELFIGMAKNSTMDWLIEKAVEVGVNKIYPIVVERSVVRPHKNELAKYTRRWQVIASDASEQSEQLFSTQIFDPQTFETLLNSQTINDQAVKFLFAADLRHQNSSHQQLVCDGYNKIFSGITDSKSIIQIFIGPEGGFSESENQSLIQKKIIAVALGKNVLRVETAVIAALTLVQTAACLTQKNLP